MCGLMWFTITVEYLANVLPVSPPLDSQYCWIHIVSSVVAYFQFETWCNFKTWHAQSITVYFRCRIILDGKVKLGILVTFANGLWYARLLGCKYVSSCIKDDSKYRAYEIFHLGTPATFMVHNLIVLQILHTPAGNMTKIYTLPRYVQPAFKWNVAFIVPIYFNMRRVRCDKNGCKQVIVIVTIT